TSDALAGLGRHPGAAAVTAATVSGYRLAFIVAAGLMMCAIVILILFLRPRHLEHVALEMELAPAGST
ncbi:MAG: hypothetical protein ACRDLP_16140, partial [Solirubrobacteraceae bacterium]